MSKLKINDRELVRLIDKDGLSQSATAKKLQVSRQAVSKRLQELRGKTTTAVVAKKIEQCVDQKIDAIAQLEKINTRANDLLDEVVEDHQTTIKVMAEIRSQLKLQLEIFSTLYSLQAAQEFQDSVLEAIAEVSPEVRKDIIARLNAKSAIRSAVTFR